MPLNKYFQGRGDKVMSSMKKQYGEEKGKKVFYATHNKQKIDIGPSSKLKKHLKVG